MPTVADRVLNLGRRAPEPSRTRALTDGEGVEQVMGPRRALGRARLSRPDLELAKDLARIAADDLGAKILGDGLGERALPHRGHAHERDRSL
jgi:hypothetical protein